MLDRISPPVPHRVAAILIGVLAAATAALPAQDRPSSTSYLAFLTDTERNALSASGDLRGFGARLDDLSIWKRAPFAATVNTALGGRDSSIAAETLFLVDLPPGSAGASLDLKILRAFTAFSTMKNLQVYSASLRKMETFIYDSWRAQDAGAKVALPDPVFSAAPESYGCVMYQKEEQTGDIYSSFLYDKRNESYVVRLRNLTEMRYLFFQLVPPNGLDTLFVVEPCSDKLVVYAVTLASTPRFLGIERLKQDSFFYRMKALASWFSANLAAER